VHGEGSTLRLAPAATNVLKDLLHLTVTHRLTHLLNILTECSLLIPNLLCLFLTITPCCSPGSSTRVLARERM